MPKMPRSCYACSHYESGDGKCAVGETTNPCGTFTRRGDRFDIVGNPSRCPSCAGGLKNGRCWVCDFDTNSQPYADETHIHPIVIKALGMKGNPVEERLALAADITKVLEGRGEAFAQRLSNSMQAAHLIENGGFMVSFSGKDYVFDVRAGRWRDMDTNRFVTADEVPAIKEAMARLQANPGEQSTPVPAPVVSPKENPLPALLIPIAMTVLPVLIGIIKKKAADWDALTPAQREEKLLDFSKIKSISSVLLPTSVPLKVALKKKAIRKALSKFTLGGLAEIGSEAAEQAAKTKAAANPSESLTPTTQTASASPPTPTAPLSSAAPPPAALRFYAMGMDSGGRRISIFTDGKTFYRRNPR